MCVDCRRCEGGVAGVCGDLGEAGGGEGLSGLVSCLVLVRCLFVWWVLTNVEVVVDMVAVRFMCYCANERVGLLDCDCESEILVEDVLDMLVVCLST